MAGKDKLRFNQWTLGGRGADLYEKSAEALELERLNPLRGVDEWRLGQVFDDARDGIYADLAWLYNEIEGVEPALMVSCDMRESAAGECGWIVRTADARRARGFDQALADEQRDALLREFGAVGDGLAELAGHLVSAFFRGAAHALPLWNADGSLAGFRHLDLWNFAYDRGAGRWYWNADASRDEDTFEPVPPGELVSLAVSRHVDHAALPIFIRAALGAKRYGVWLDRFGIPPVGVIMPATAEKGEQSAYMDLARKFARGGSGILPNGSNVIYGTEARAVCPFPEFIRFQQQQIYAAALGRVQSGESGADNLGGNAAGVVETGFRRIVRRDARRIAAAINAGVTRRIVARLFPGRPVLAQFAWDTDEKRTGREVLEDAGLARNAGLAIDRVQLEELTGYTLVDAPQAQPVGFGGLANSATPLQSLASPLQNARRGGGGISVPPEAADAPGAILRGFAADMGPAAEKINSLLKRLDAGEDVRDDAARLAEELPSLMPDDPAMAAVIAEAMAGEFAGTVADKGAVKGEGAVKNSTDANGNEHAEAGSGNGGQFVGKGGGGDSAATAKKSGKSLDGKAREVKPERVSEIAAGTRKDYISPEEGLAVVLSDPTIKSADGRELKFDQALVAKYKSGQGRSFNEPDADRFKLVQAAIYAVRHDDNPQVKLGDKNITGAAYLPRGAQRLYHADVGGGKTVWVFTYADKIYIRSIQERAKNNPPYK